MATSVAVLGTGIMGAPMARNLAAAGLEVRAWNRTAAKAQALEEAAEKFAVIYERERQTLHAAWPRRRH